MEPDEELATLLIAEAVLFLYYVEHPAAGQCAANLRGAVDVLQVKLNTARERIRTLEARIEQEAVFCDEVGKGWEPNRAERAARLRALLGEEKTT